MVHDAIHAKGAGSSNGLDEGVLGEPGGMSWRASDCWRTTCTGDREISCGPPVNMNRRPDLAKGREGGLDPWAWRLAESRPRGQAGKLLLSEVKQGAVQAKWKQRRRSWQGFPRWCRWPKARCSGTELDGARWWRCSTRADSIRPDPAAGVGDDAGDTRTRRVDGAALLALAEEVEAGAAEQRLADSHGGRRR